MNNKSAQKLKIEKIRREYTRETLSKSSVKKDPIDQFLVWFEQALSADLPDANAMTLSTATRSGIPSSRIVLLKGINEQGFWFYTNYKSRKGRELEQNPVASLCIYWASLERQVCVEGKVTKAGREESDTYFRERPRLSRIGAWASEQSSRVASREELEARFNKAKQKFTNKKIPLPDFWGGYILQPSRIEFWQGRKDRMHDRICYEWNEENLDWDIFRLTP